MRDAGELDGGDQAVLLRALMKIIWALQISGDVAPVRACVSCCFFRPHVRDDTMVAHYCDSLNTPLGDRDLRLDCGLHDPAPGDQADDVCQRFVVGATNA